ncbi:hypothetical protein [Streptomyces tsukubensis]|uniref:Uncharacterized protein n=1 Tax=Streptomyces tsukubensis TaxID=83656 RepID=A0A1V4A109_9ACTN|nr:hypothetical protein [Streptomyces tsukubensis]OON72181.1 hypothetical protein B1H18_30775 [Streptomyces tsukubensis]
MARERGEALLVERLSALDFSPVHFRVGGRLPRTATGVGLVPLAFAPTAVQDHAIAAHEPGGGSLGQGHDDVRAPSRSSPRPRGSTAR